MLSKWVQILHKDSWDQKETKALQTKKYGNIRLFDNENESTYYNPGFLSKYTYYVL